MWKFQVFRHHIASWTWISVFIESVFQCWSHFHFLPSSISKREARPNLEGNPWRRQEKLRPSASPISLNLLLNGPYKGDTRKHAQLVSWFLTFSFNQFPTIIEWLQEEPILSLPHCNPILYCRYCIEHFTRIKQFFSRFLSSKCVFMSSFEHWTLFLVRECEWTKWGMDAGSNLGRKRETDEVLKVDIWFAQFPSCTQHQKSWHGQNNI